jgi:hypothetical protein
MPAAFWLVIADCLLYLLLNPGKPEFPVRDLRERNPDGIADTIFQQGTNAHRAFNSSILAVTLRLHPGVGDIFRQLFLHGFYQHPVCLHHHCGLELFMLRTIL